MAEIDQQILNLAESLPSSPSVSTEDSWMTFSLSLIIIQRFVRMKIINKFTNVAGQNNKNLDECQLCRKSFTILKIWKNTCYIIMERNALID